MLELRPATPADREYVRRIKHAAYRSMVVAQFGAWDDAVQDAFFEKSWSAGNYSIVLADGAPCGFCRLDEHDRTLQLVEFAVDVEKQGQGIGSRVLCRFVDMARAKGKIAQLNVMKTNTRAKTLYERVGFATYAENDSQYLMRYDEVAVGGQASMRLAAALAAGTNPDPAHIDMLVAHCAVEPDFYVRDMLTWALTRHPPAQVVPRLLQQLRSPVAQARSQALHTLSKIRDPGTWGAITPDLLRDPDIEVARSAWRAAVVLVPANRKHDLAANLVAQLGRGDRQVQLSLSRALVALGPEATESALRDAMHVDDPAVRAHALASLRLLEDPDAAFALDVDAADRAFRLGRGR